jgi:hypothetical protein
MTRLILKCILLDMAWWYFKEIICQYRKITREQRAEKRRVRGGDV